MKFNRLPFWGPTPAMRSILRDYESDEFFTVRNATHRLTDHTRRDLPVRDGQAALEAIRSGRLSRKKNAICDTPAARLMSSISNSPHPGYIQPIVAVYAKLDKKARRTAAIALAKVGSAESAEAVLRIVDRHAPDGGVPWLAAWHWQERPAALATLFPRLLGYLEHPGMVDSIAEIAMYGIADGNLDPGRLAAGSDHIIAAYEKLEPDVRRLQRSTPDPWQYEKQYAEQADALGGLINMLQYLPRSLVESLLNDALSFADPMLLYTTILARTRLGLPVPDRAIERAAASPEVRLWIHDLLEDVDQLKRMPERYRTREALAEAELVAWLSSPAEFGQPPEEIQLMHGFVGWLDPDDDLPEHVRFTYYLFRFRISPYLVEKDEWMAGLVGPYLSRGPDPEIKPSVSSVLAPWDEYSPEEHLGDALEMIEDSWSYPRESASERAPGMNGT